MSAKETPKVTPKLSKDTIYADPDDEITALINKVESAEHKIVALVLPKRFSTLQSIVNMRLLKRSADNASKNIVLITNDTSLLPLAGAAGLHVAKNLQSKPAVPSSPLDEKELPSELEDELDAKEAKLDYHRSIGELAASHSVDEPEAIALDNKEKQAPSKRSKSTKDKKLSVPNFDRFRLLLGLGALAFVGLIVFLVLAIFVLPKAIIAIQTESTPISADFTLTASDKIKGLDIDKKEIPAELKKSDQTANQTVQATGQKNLGEKASGKVTLKNCSDSPVTVPAGAGVSSGGLVFITQSSTALDSGNFTSGNVCKSTGSHVKDVSVTAQSPGSKYNIGPSSFTVSGYGGVSGSSASSMSGGSDVNITVLTQQDVDKAEQKITAADSDKFSKDFQKQLEDQGFYVIGSTLKLSDAQTNASPAVGQETSTANVSVKITHSVLVVPREDLKKIVTHVLEEQIDKSRQRLDSEDVLRDTTVTVANMSGPASASLTVTDETAAVPIIDENGVKKQVAGKKKGDIKEIIGQWPGVKNVEVDMSPFWVSKAPKKASKVTVKLQGVSSENQGSER